MKMNYKANKKQFIGSSDIASLTIRIPRNAFILDFGKDGNYYAYVIDESYEIPEHYQCVGQGNSWLKIYDDEELVRTFKADEILIYRAGEMGCIIQTINH